MVAVIDLPAPQLRNMHREDLVQIADIEQSAYEFGWPLGIFRDCLRAGHACWVLAAGSEILGYGVLSHGAGEAHVLNVCVAPAQQGKGHGRRLLKRLLDTARWYGVERVFLEVRPSNTTAQALYESEGFNEVGRRPRYYPARNGREDAIIMAMDLLPQA
ncbi:MAG TPA: ribosomal protein S18-alanine N-acetyltransferase [Rhodanobacteraceae bacterium]